MFNWKGSSGASNSTDGDEANAQNAVVCGESAAVLRQVNALAEGSATEEVTNTVLELAVRYCGIATQSPPKRTGGACDASMWHIREL